MSASTSAGVAPSVGAVLEVIHHRWNAQIMLTLAPAADIHSDLWGRWDAARFLSGRFQDRFRLECALVQKLGELIGPGATGRLAAIRGEIDRVRGKLIAEGRGQGGSPASTATLARRFIEAVARWCVELEAATTQLAPEALPHDTRQVLARLRVADALGA